MRDFLTIIACALVVLLTAALIGPHIVDWNAERGRIEARLSEALGARVKVRGGISLTLLPTPSLSVGDVAVESPVVDGPSLRVERADFELALTALLRGEIQFMRADLESPVLRLTQRAGGALALPDVSTDLPQQINFDEVRVRNATLIVERGGAGDPWRLDHVDLQAKAGSLIGPFSGVGAIGQGPSAVAFRFETGSRSGAGVPFQASLSAGANVSPLALDGALILSPVGDATLLSYEGSVKTSGVVKLSGFADLKWSLQGVLRASLAGASLARVDLRLGPDDRAIDATATGATNFVAGSPIQASLVAQQVDMDRLLGGLGPDSGRRLTDAIANALSDASLFDRLRRPLRLSLSTDALTLGGETLVGARARVSLGLSGPAQIDLNSGGPGGSHISWSGSLEPGPAAVLRGHLDVGASDVVRLADWLSPALPKAAARLKAAPFRALTAAADVEISGAGFAARSLVIKADRTVLHGSAAYTRVIGSQRARLYADLQSDALDLDALPDLSGSAEGAKDMDLALSLDARAVRLAHFGQGMVDAGRIVVNVSRSGSNVKLTKLSLSNVGGATLSATGEANVHDARLDATLDASRLGDLAALVNRIAPGRFANAFVARAVALSPARMTLHVEATRSADGAFLPAVFSIRGSARGAQASGDLTPDRTDAHALDLDLDLKGPDSSILLRQLGFDALPIVDSGAGRLRVHAHGRPDGDLQTSLDASFGGCDMTFNGAIANWLSAPAARGAFELKSGDATPFLRLMTVVLPDPLLRLPASLSATASAKGGAYSLSDIGGVIAGAHVSGSATLAPGAVKAQITGSLAVDRLPLSALTTLALGPSAEPSRGDVWSKAKFAPGLSAPPRAEVSLSVDDFALAPGWTGRGASLHLQIGPGLVALRTMSMKVGDGSLSGDVVLRRDGAAASVTADLQARQINVDNAYFSAHMSGKAAFAATGESDLQLVNGLAGGGSLAMQDLHVTRTDRDALARVLGMSGDKDFGIDAPNVESAFAKELDKGPLEIGSRAFDLQTAGGVLRLNGVSTQPADSQITHANVALSFDLRTLAMDERVALIAASSPPDWPDRSPPNMVVVWKKTSSAAAARTIEADGFIGELSARAAAHEAARISSFDADIQERAFFNRRLKGLQFMHRREQEVSAWKAQQARRAKALEAEKQPAALANGSVAAPIPKSSASGPGPQIPPPTIGQDPLSFGRF